MTHTHNTGTRDGIVEGSAGSDRIDRDYRGDPEGDRIDAGDAVLPGQSGDMDIVDAGAGDDVIHAGAEADQVYAGAGDDCATGGAGNDTLYGDSTAPGGGADDQRLVFRWDQAPDPGSSGSVDPGDDLSGGFTQDVGGVTVAFSTVSDTHSVDTEFSDRDQRVQGIEDDGTSVNDESALLSDLNGDANSAEYALDFSQEVTGISFRINDIDGDGVVTVRAFDGDGNLVEVTLDGGRRIDLSDTDSVPGDDTADGTGGYDDPDSKDYSVLVSIPGPVARLEILHDQDGGANTGIYLTDIYFDADLGESGAAGDDTLSGGDGDDVIFGEGGDDCLSGGDGSDTVEGGDGNDWINTAGHDHPLPDRAFPGYGVVPPIPVDPLPDNDRDLVDGGAGHDTIITGDDADTVRGGDGDDVIGGGLDADEIDGGTGDDCIVGGEGSDTIEGGDGADTIFGGLNPIFPDAFNIRDDGTAGPPDPDPGNGRDLIDGGAGDDLIHGQDDDDTLLGGAGDDTLDGGIDDDVLLGGTGADSLIGGQGDDLLFGGTDTDADRLSGGAGQDTLAALSGDSVQGGEGGPVDFDTLFVGGGIPVVSTTAGDPEAGTVSIYDSDLNPVGTVSFEEVERVLALDLNGASPATLSGATGTAGIVDGTDAGDLIDTGYTGDPEGDRVDAGDAEPPLTGDQDVILAGGGDDTVRAGEESDLVFGGAGDDDLAGQAGNDGLSGGLGDDTLSGGAGRDIAVGGAGDDVISGDNSVAGDGGDLLYGNTGSDRFINIGAGETVVGGEDADGSDHDVLDLTGAAEAVNPGGSLVVDEDAPGSESGTVRFLDAGGAETGTMTYSEIEEVIICFTPGTLIATPQGERPVETLQQGDRVITRDNGIQPLAWVGHSPQSAQDLAARPHLRPVRIRAGALGGGLPERDMLVSPNHRLLIANDRTSYYFDEREVLVAAKHLTGLDGVEMAPAAPNTYVHFMFEQHEVVLGDGAWSESFQPGDYSLSGIASEQRDEILELFPELATPEGLNDYEAARRSLKRHEARLLVV